MAFARTTRPTTRPATGPASRPASRTRISAVSRQLDHEWHRLRRRPVAVATVNGWQLVATTITDLQEVLVAVGYRAAGRSLPERDAQNERLHRLVERARTDDLAARIVLQRLLPGLVVDLARRGDHDHQSGGRFEELVGSAWISIRAAHVAPDSPCVAGRLMDDAWYRAFKAPRRRRAAQEVVVDPCRFQALPAATEPTPFEELAALVAEARRHGLDAEDLKLVRALMRTESAGRVAAERKVTARTVRNHRDRAVHSLRRLAAA